MSSSFFKYLFYGGHGLIAIVLAGFLLPSSQAGDIASEVAATLDRSMAAAEASLRAGQVEAAAHQYRQALGEGWLVVGTLDRLEGDGAQARAAFRAASEEGSAVALQSLALVHIEQGEAAQAIPILEDLAAKDPRDTRTRRLLARALLASGHPERAVQEMEEAQAAAPTDLELTFALADGYLRLKRVDRAAGLFARIVQARPIPQTHVLIGRAYRDSSEYARAQAELRAALKQDPQVRHAHYELGMVALEEKGLAGVEEALAEFHAELELAPGDALASRELGVALVESQRSAEAVPALETAARAEPASSRILYYLGRAQLGAGRPAEAAVTLTRALELAREQGGNAHALRGVHVHLGRALQALGRTDEASTHFDEAARLSAQDAAEARDRFDRPTFDSPPAEAANMPAAVIESSPLAVLSMPERNELRRRASLALARAYFNLGVMQAQGQHFAPAAELLEKAAGLDPDFPQLQSSLGIAYFNTRQFEKATGPLSRAVAAAPADRGVKRMLALAWLNTESYAKAAELLQDDPEREADASLQFAYGLALIKSDRATEAERVFGQLLRSHGDSAELSVLLGQAHAQQGDFDAAIESLKRALGLKADVAEASSTLGVIYLRQGRMAEAEAALRAELEKHPSDLQAQQNLASVLDLQQRPEEALPLLRRVVEAKPELSEPRYLLGKILLAQGAAAEAIEHLETAARLAPGDANVHYQLGRAYQKVGKPDRAEQEFELFRQIKARK